MSYIVLARKWRPRGFDDLVGQESVVKTFKNALSGEKVVHAYLFSGPRGVGKTSTARILAKALNCTNRTDTEPCGECDSCRAITDSASVDVFEIDGASNTSVESVRELREAVKYAPSGGKYKIYIIDEVHMLSTPAFNALLKTLEEPPAHVVFIFATTEPKKIPATILSRCQHHFFRRITRNDIREHLWKITESEHIQIADRALDMITKAADGSMRDALTLLDQAASFADEITEHELIGLLGLPETEIISNLSRSILSGDISGTLSVIKELTDRGSDLRQIARELIEQFRNITIVKVSSDAGEVLEFTEEEVQTFRDLSANISLEQLTLLLTELLKLEAEVRSAVNPRYTLELGLLRMSFVKGMISIEDVLKKLGKQEGPDSRAASPTPPRAHPGTSEKKTAPPVQPAAESAPEELNKDELWRKLIEGVDAVDHLLACKLSEAKAVSLTADELAIGFNGGMSVLADSIEKSTQVIMPMLRKISGRKLKLKILALPGQDTKKNTSEIKDKVFAEPLVKDAMKIFRGSLIRVRSLENDSDGAAGDYPES